MSEDLNLISTCSFREKEFVLNLKVISSHTLDVKVTDKFSGEVWAGSYDCTYIENLTHKTGNFKQFDVFLSMLRSGFLRTSDSITLDLLSYEDLEALRSLRKGTSSFYSNAGTTSNKRYLIVTYSVEFDRIHYPLPLDYCGPPNPLLLQATIRKLESEVIRLKELLEKRKYAKDGESPHSTIIKELENRVKELTIENDLLTQDLEELADQLSKQQLTKPSHNEMRKTIAIIEQQVEQERQNFQEQVKLLQSKNQELMTQLGECQKSEAYLQAQVRQLQAQSDGKGSSPLTASRRVRIRRNKYQLPPLPDRIPHREQSRSKLSPRCGMMGDGINVRVDGAIPRRPTGRALIPRVRNPSESSASSVRSSSADSRNSLRKKGDKKKEKMGRNMKDEANMKDEVRKGKKLGGKQSSLSSKDSGKSAKTVLKKSSTNILRPYHSSCESFHSDNSNVTPQRRKKKIIRNLNKVPSNGN